jgi:hypothetical protein
MRKIQILAALLLILATTLACSVSIPDVKLEIVTGSGKTASEERPVSAFTKVELNGVGSLKITQGEQESLNIEGDDNILPLITTEVKDGTLLIGIKKGYTVNPKASLTYNLTVKNLDQVELNGLGEVTMDGLQTEAFSIFVRGSGNTKIEDLVADTLRVEITGLGDITMSGTVDSQVVVISGSGNYKARDLSSKDAEVRISGLGSAKLRVSDNLDARISGGGDIEYIGDPAVQQKVEGLGDIEQVEE